jgi:hypothetical protein
VIKPLAEYSPEERVVPKLGASGSCSGAAQHEFLDENTRNPHSAPGEGSVVLSPMPSNLHEAHVLLFRNRPEMAAELIRDVLGVKIPAFKEAQIFSAEFTEVAPTERRPDLIVRLRNENPVYAVIVEIQLREWERKRFVWPYYAASLRAHLKCPVGVLVVTTDDAVARWAAKPIDTGGIYPYAPYVLGPSGVPAITSEVEARAHPELAVLSAMAHGKDADRKRAARIATVARAASLDLDFEISRLYFDLVSSSLSEAARRALRFIDISKYQYQSEFAKRYVAEGRREGVTQGEASGRLSILSRLLALRFGPITAEVHDRLRHASVEDLDAIGERVLFAHTLQEALGG